MELALGESTQTETPLYDGETPPLLTQPPSQYTPLVDVPDTLVSPPPRPHKDRSNAVCLASESNLPVDRLTAADDMLFRIYQDWVHQHFGTHLDREIKEG